MCCGTLFSKLWRRKPLPRDPLETPLKRCLNTFDLSLLGIGNMVGAGVFLLSGVVAKNIAGPGIVLCYLFAGIAILLSSICYAEFGAKLPRAGSAYVFTYCTMGELPGFIVGWSVLLERLLSGAAVARGWSAMFDAMFNDVIRNSTMDHLGEIHVDGMSEFPDFIAFVVAIIAVIIVSVGVSCLTWTNMMFTALNILTIVVVIGLSMSRADWNNWSSEALGGFLPYGFQGVVAGSATLFYTFVGFESITHAAEEAVDPSSQIPVASIVAIMFTTLLYMCAGAGLTLMVPFYNLDPDSAFSSAFRQLGLDWAVYVVSLGALMGITTSVLMDIYALPRTVYSMASDGLLFKFLAKVHPETQTPIVATVLFGVLMAFVAMLTDYQTLIEFLSIGTLISFTVVAVCVIVSRYRPPEDVHVTSQTESSPLAKVSTTAASLQHASDAIATAPLLKSEFKDSHMMKAIPGSVMIYLSIILLIICTVILSLLLKYNDAYDIYGPDKTWLLGVVFACLIGVFTAMFYMSAYEELNEPATFSVPLLPHTPAMSIMINVAMIVQLPEDAWLRYAVWLAIGLCVYFFYGIRHSDENRSIMTESTLMSYSALAASDELDNDMSYTPPTHHNVAVGNLSPDDEVFYDS